nr:MAG TPA: hypothetical protein [Caudoviricetes sp.]
MRCKNFCKKGCFNYYVIVIYTPSKGTPQPDDI